MLSSDKFATDGKFTIPDEYVVAYDRAQVTYGEDHGGGSGSNPLLMILSLAVLSFLRMRMK